MRGIPVFFCFCGPTGCGKTTLTKKLIQSDPSLFLSVSTTTRSPRAGELDGREYFFVTRDEFLNRVKTGRFVEFAEVSGELYGTERTNFERCTERGADLLLDIDYQGASALREEFGQQVCNVFVFPPSFSVLEERLRSRAGSDSPERIANRLEIAEREIAELTTPGFSDYFLVNDTVESSLSGAQAIVRAERMRFNRFPLEVIQQFTHKG